jgi:TPR repeat protein
VSQARRAPEELEQFCALLRDLRNKCGQPSLTVLRRSMPSAPGTSTLSDLLNGKISRPPRWELVSELVAACKSWAGRSGRQLPSALADISEWRSRHEDLIRILEALQRAARKPVTVDELPLIAAMPVAEWNPVDLGVHRAIDVASALGNTAENGLTPYIRRPHDQELCELLTDASLPLAVFVLGESSTGKTRSCLEAVKRRIPEWPIMYPADSRELCEILARHSGDTASIIWLDEAQIYFSGEGSSAAAGLLTRLMLSRAQPVLVIGTMWPKYWRELVTPPRDQLDYSASVRKLLSLSSVKRVQVAGDFSVVPAADLTAAARGDSRLNIALASAGPEHSLAQVLAGGVQLIDRYRTTLDIHSRTVITAAMDCRRLGYHSPMPPAMLIASLSSYLSPQARAVGPETVSLALEQVTQKVNGIGALEPVRVAPGIGTPDAYMLHDYLHHLADLERKYIPIPPSAWEALNRHAVNFDDRVRLSWQAVFRHYDRLATRFLEDVVETDHAAQDSLRLVWMLERAGHNDRTESILEAAAHAGELSAMRELAERRLRAKDHAGALDWFRRAAELKDAEAMLRLGGYPHIPTLSWQEAGYWLEQAAALGNIQAMRKIAWELADIRPAEALEWLRRGAQTGEGNIMFDLVKMLDETGEQTESRKWIDRLVETRQFHMIGPLAEWLEENGRLGEAETCLKRATATGELTIAYFLSDFLERICDAAAAVGVWREQIETRRLSGMSYFTAKRIVRQIEAARETDSASKWLRAAANSGCPHSALIIVELTDTDDAEDLLRQAIKLENFWAMPQLIELLERQHRIEEAEALLRTTVETAPFFDAWRMLTDFVERTGRPDEAEALRRYGIEPGGLTAAPW